MTRVESQGRVVQTVFLLCQTKSLGEQFGAWSGAGLAQAKSGPVMLAGMHIAHAAHHMTGALRRVQSQPFLEQIFDLKR